MHDAEAALDAVLADVSEHGVTEEELDLARNRLIADTVYAQDNQGTLARWYGAALATGADRRDGARLAHGIRAVTADAVRERRAKPGSTAALGDRLSRQQPAGAEEKHS